jgi:hypothetical protein
VRYLDEARRSISHSPVDLVIVVMDKGIALVEIGAVA